MGRGKGAGTGQPIYFKCAAERRERSSIYVQVADGIRHVVVRTGRTRGPGLDREVGTTAYGRMMLNAHEYRCSCGHIGWTKHHGILRKPLEGTP